MRTEASSVRSPWPAADRSTGPAMVTCFGFTWAVVAWPVLFTTTASSAMVYCEPLVVVRHGCAPETVAWTVKGTATSVPLEVTEEGRSWISMLMVYPACAEAAGARAIAASTARKRTDRRDMEGLR